LQPTVACEFKRAGFLEGEAIETLLPIQLQPATRAVCKPTAIQACAVDARRSEEKLRT